MLTGKANHFTRNVASVGAVEFFWGLGFPIVLESTFLQLFLRHLGASSFLIGLVPTIFILGISCFPLFSSYLTRNSLCKGPIVFKMHLVCALSIFCFGCALFFLPNSSIIPVFFLSYTIFSISIGLTIPVWLTFLVNIFTEERTVVGFGYMMLAQNSAKVISSFFILKAVENYAFSTHSCAVIFLTTGAIFFLGSLFFVFTREQPTFIAPDNDTSNFFAHTKRSFEEIRHNKKFIIFLLADLDTYIIIVIFSFYANYATEHFMIQPSIAAGVFVACIYAGSIIVNIALGTMNLLNLKQKFLLSKFVTFSTLILLITLPASWCFFLISFFLGFARAIRNVVYTPGIKKISGKDDATSYFAMAPILTLPISFGLPVIFGRALDLLAPKGALSYQLSFMGLLFLLLITFYFSLKVEFTSSRSND